MRELFRITGNSEVILARSPVLGHLGIHVAVSHFRGLLPTLAKSISE